APFKFLDYFIQSSIDDQFGRVDRNGSGCNKIKVFLLTFMDAITQIIFSNEQGAHPFGIVHIKTFMDLWLSHIQIENNHFFTAVGNTASKVDGYKSFSLT